MLSFVRPAISHVVRPAKPFRLPAVLPLDMEVEGLSRTLALTGKRLCPRQRPSGR